MIKFTGRSSLKQYMPMKPVKRGIKVWVLADSHNGYFSKFQVYMGKKDGVVEKGLGARVVKDLTSSLKGKYHHVYFDNFFTSTELIWSGMESTPVAPQERIGRGFRRPKLSNRSVNVYERVM